MCGVFERFDNEEDTNAVTVQPPGSTNAINLRPVVGKYADYVNTGLWTFKEGLCIAPDDLTIEQLKDHLLLSGGAVYLHESGRLCWFNKIA